MILIYLFIALTLLSAVAAFLVPANLMIWGWLGILVGVVGLMISAKVLGLVGSGK